MKKYLLRIIQIGLINLFGLVSHSYSQTVLLNEPFEYTFDSDPSFDDTWDVSMAYYWKWECINGVCMYYYLDTYYQEFETGKSSWGAMKTIHYLYYSDEDFANCIAFDTTFQFKTYAFRKDSVYFKAGESYDISCYVKWDDWSEDLVEEAKVSFVLADEISPTGNFTNIDTFLISKKTNIDYAILSTSYVPTKTGYYFPGFRFESELSINTVDSECWSQTDAGFYIDDFTIEAFIDMEIMSLDPIQNNTDLVKPGSKNNEILAINIKTYGDQNPKSVQQFTFTTTGSDDPVTDIKSARLFYTGNSSIIDTAESIGTLISGPNGTFTFDFTSLPLLQDDNYFWLTYDIQDSATIFNNVDATLESVTTNDSTYVPSNKAPSGSRVIVEFPAENISANCSQNSRIVGLYTSDNWVLRVAVINNEIRFASTLNEIIFNSNGSTLPIAENAENAKLFSTGNSNEFSSITQVGNTVTVIPDGEYSFNNLNLQLVPDTNYFWLTYDIDGHPNAHDNSFSGSALIGEIVDAEVVSIIANDEELLADTIYIPEGQREIENSWVGRYDGFWRYWGQHYNWANGIVPTQTTNVVIPGGRQYYPSVSRSPGYRCNDLIIEPGGIIDHNQTFNFYVYGNLINDGDYNSGSHEDIVFKGVNKSISGSGVFSNSRTDIIIASGASYDIKRDIICRNFTVENNATVNLGSNNLIVNNDFNLNSGSTFNLESGTTISNHDFNLNSGATFNQGTGLLKFNDGVKIEGTINPDSGTTWFNLQADCCYNFADPNNHENARFSITDFYNLKVTVPHDIEVKKPLTCQNLTLYYQWGWGMFDINPGSSILVRDSLIIYDSSAEISIQENSTLTVQGPIINNGKIWAESSSTPGILELSGEGNQRIIGNPFNIMDLKIDKPSGDILLETNLGIDGVATFNDGLVIYQNNSFVTFLDNGTVATASNISHIVGRVKKISAIKSSKKSFKFPIGDGTFYRPIAITPNNANDNAWTVTYADSGLVRSRDTINHYFKPNKKNLFSVDTAKYWNIDRLDSNTNASIEIFWDNDPRIKSTSDLVVAHFNDNDSLWESAKRAQIKGDTSSGSVVSIPNWSKFSPFTLGVDKKNSNTPLPIKLLKFNAYPERGLVKIEWETATEINNDHFTIQRSKDGENFEELTTISGAGNSNRNLEYELYDENPFSGTSYYRLQQTDYDGKYEIFEPVRVYINNAALGMLSIYPNPVINYINIYYQNEDVEHIIIEVYNAIGQRLEGINKMNNTDNHLTRLNLESLNPGLYFIQIQDGTGKPVVKKFIKK
ncbi:T9SS type A sorting domain-containing protein [Sphingobacteriaceae bacterium AH-315-L07]|nr:T9SS type A sorting domain-containing protein [Sphingobacteriaceae bacterium AH-315-L07]